MPDKDLRYQIKCDLFEAYKTKFSDILSEDEIYVLWWYTAWDNGCGQIAKKLGKKGWQPVRDMLENIDAKLRAL